MAESSISPLMRVPAVTQEDLNNFHVLVFGSPAPRQLLCTEQQLQNSAVCEDDDLGYYPDGAKRTLTDDQIAMFRHSEVYSILRERQVRKENLEAEGVDQSEVALSQPEEAVEATTLSDEKGEVPSAGGVKEIFAPIPGNTPQHVEVTHTSKKRRRGVADTDYVHGKKYASRSARGFVRELDSAAAEEQILDYGDEPSLIKESKQNEVAVAQVPEQERGSQASPPEGRRIWWPIIEAP